jgi:hypothetical protein
MDGPRSRGPTSLLPEICGIHPAVSGALWQSNVAFRSCYSLLQLHRGRDKADGRGHVSCCL